jgi:aminoglycoside 6'-N-acetyltransferase
VVTGDEVAPIELPRSTAHLVLRALRPGDEADVRAYRGREDVSRYLMRGPLSADEVVELVAKRQHQTSIDVDDDWLSLVLELDGRVVGDVSLHCLSVADGQAEIGWVLNPDFGGQGLATEAARAVLGIAFDEIGLHRVVARLDPRNSPSQRLCVRLGMRLEAHLREESRFKGEWADLLVYAMLRAEWERGRAAGPSGCDDRLAGGRMGS